MLDIALRIIKELQFVVDHHCKICGGMDPQEYDHQAAGFVEREMPWKTRGHNPGCKIRFLLLEAGDLEDYL